MNKEEALGYQFRTISNEIQRCTEAAISAQNIEDSTGIHSWVMRYLLVTQKKEVFQKDIEEDLDMQRSTASRVLALMEQNGLITRESVDYDKRLKRILPTQKLYERDRVITQEIHRLEEQMRKGISSEEMETFFNVLEKIKENLQLF